MSTITFQQLQTENLITFDFLSVTKNFKTIDSFIKNFATFQKKLADLQKAQKAAALDLSNFKISTSNAFSTMNDILDSRGSISKGNNKGIEDDLNEVKKTIKELKAFVTQSTRDINATLQSKQKQTQQVYKKYEANFSEIQTYRESDKLRVESLESEIYVIKSKYALRTEAEIIRSNLNEAKEQIESTKQTLEHTQQFLQSLGVKQFRDTLDLTKKEVEDELSSMRTKLKLKTDISDTLKLQDMLLNTINLTYQNVVKKYSNKNQTKKALVYLEKKINNIVQTLFPQEEEKDGLLAVKNWKCISCSKDLGEYEGKLEKFKPWAVFPAKDGNHKDKYGGFGTAFQSIVETAVSKKGGDINYDQKGRMTTPFNLTREVQSNLKPSHSQHKLSNHTKNSPSKLVSESNYMNLFGRNSEVDLDIRSQYLQKERGLLQLSKIKFE